MSEDNQEPEKDDTKIQLSEDKEDGVILEGTWKSFFVSFFAWLILGLTLASIALYVNDITQTCWTGEGTMNYEKLTPGMYHCMICKYGEFNRTELQKATMLCNTASAWNRTIKVEGNWFRDQIMYPAGQWLTMNYFEK